MRFVSVFSAFLAALLSLLLIFGCYKEKTAIATMNTKYDSIRAQAETYRTQTEELKRSLTELEQQKTKLQTRLSALEKREAYKTTPTAFLTFDECFTAPTAECLNVLNEAGIKGTFFIIGKNLEDNPRMQETLKAAYDAGHQIGIRSDSDKASEIYAGEDAFFADLYACQNRIEEIIGVKVRLVRMRGGTASAQYHFKKNTGSDDTYQNVVDRLEREGFIINDWTVDSKDAETKSVDTIISNVKDGGKKALDSTYKTCLVQFSGNNRTVSALPEIIRNLTKQGYTFAPLPSDLPITRQR